MPKPKRNNTHRRVQLDFGEELYCELGRLQKLSNATSYTETIRHAMGMFGWILDELQEGNTIFVGKKDNEGKQELQQIVFPLLAKIS